MSIVGVLPLCGGSYWIDSPEHHRILGMHESYQNAFLPCGWLGFQLRAGYLIHLFVTNVFAFDHKDDELGQISAMITHALEPFGNRE